MRDTPRLLVQGADDFERALLRSAARDAGSSRARARCLAAAAGASVMTGAAASAASGGTALLAKWVGIGLVAGLGTVGAAQGGAYAIRSLSSPSAPSTKPSGPSRPVSPGTAAGPHDSKAQPEAAPASALPSRLPAIAPTADSSAQAVRTDERTGFDNSARSGPAAAFSDEDHALDREVALLDAARSALSAGDGRRALSLLGTREREFPRGALGPEARLTRVKALLLLGDRRAAEAEARRLEQAQPGGPHASRSRQLVEETAKKP